MASTKQQNKNLIAVLYFLLFFIFILPLELISQSISKSTISGQITDRETGVPLQNVNLFLLNTTIGSSTGADGRYIITNIPKGGYNLIVSHISYELLNIQLNLFTPDSIFQNFSLTHRILEVDNISIEGAVPKEWKKNLKIFTELFIGKTKNSKKCKILNPEVINFKFDQETKILTASSDSVIRINNQALGYQINIMLRSFEHNIDDKFLKFVIYPKFENLNHLNKKEQQTWQENRRKAYIGSFNHFMTALATDYLSKEKFSLYYVIRPNRFERIRINPSNKILLLPYGTGQRRFYFEGYINVKHKTKPNSWIKIENKLTLIDSLGNYYPSDGIKKWGGWSDERIADLLPLDYEPEK